MPLYRLRLNRAPGRLEVHRHHVPAEGQSVVHQLQDAGHHLSHLRHLPVDLAATLLLVRHPQLDAQLLPERQTRGEGRSSQQQHPQRHNLYRLQQRQDGLLGVQSHHQTGALHPAHFALAVPHFGAGQDQEAA